MKQISVFLCSFFFFFCLFLFSSHLINQLPQNGILWILSLLVSVTWVFGFDEFMIWGFCFYMWIKVRLFSELGD